MHTTTDPKDTATLALAMIEIGYEIDYEITATYDEATECWSATIVVRHPDGTVEHYDDHGVGQSAKAALLQAVQVVANWHLEDLP